MGYVEENLMAGEVVVHRARLHSVVLFWPWLLGIVFGLSGVAGLVIVAILLSEKSGNSAAAAKRLLGPYATSLLIAAVAIYIGVRRRSSTEMVVTNKRVIAKSGLLGRKTSELMLQKVESVGIEQSVLGRMVGYGDLVVKGTGGTAERFKYVEAPMEFRHCIQEQVERSRGEVRGAPSELSSRPTPMSYAPRFCSHCGAGVGSDARFCPKCGAAASV